MNTTNCNLCGTNIAYLNGHPMNLSRQYANGARYYRGSHTETCDGGAARRQQAEELAHHERTQRRAAGARRYMAAYATTHTRQEVLDRQLEIMEYVYG